MNSARHDSGWKRPGSASAKDLRALASRFQNLLEKQRTRLAQELHDNLTQKLTVVSLELSLLDSGMAGEHELSRAQIREKIKELGQIILEVIHSLRKIKAELRPKVLDEFGLVAALEWESEAFQSKTGLSCRFRAEPDQMTVAPNVGTELFRIFQEILANVAAHAKARRVQVELRQDAKRVTLQVQDDGRGITAEQIASAKSIGVLELRERAKALGGEIHISGSPRGGTSVTVSVPASPAEAKKSVS